MFKATPIALAPAVSLVLLFACSSRPAPHVPDVPSEPVAAETTDADSATRPEPPATALEAISAAVGHPDRPKDDKARDADRKPAQVLALFEVRPGMKVADLMTGTGYYAELLARAVGPTGVVYAQNNQWVWDRFAKEGLPPRLARPGLENVEQRVAELGTLGFEAGELDAAFMVLFYHDTVWQKVDRPAMNQDIFAALSPGAVFGVIDHHAKDGAGGTVSQTLHRIEKTLVVEEILAAGFVLEEDSDLLSHAEDPREASVFDEAIRGKTDRFVLRFRKPKN